MTQTNPTALPEHRDPSADSESLLHLHKMSTTAGLGSGEYVAINITAVVAALFGVASMLALVNDILLVIPVVGAILSLVALAQIRNSNGTQTGMGLAIIGLLLSGGITIGLICTRIVVSIHRSQDQQAISSLCTNLGQLVTDKKYDQAYALFDGDFQDRVPANLFKIHLATIQESKFAPPIDQMTWNGMVLFQTDQGGSDSAETVIKVHYKGSPAEERTAVWLHKTPDGWKFDNIPELFPPVQQSQTAGPSPAGR